MIAEFRPEVVASERPSGPSKAGAPDRPPESTEEGEFWAVGLPTTKEKPVQAGESSLGALLWPGGVDAVPPR
jgi:hypothetical protein